MTVEEDAAVPDRSPRYGLLLAGGLGRRMGGADKGLLPWHGRPLAAWVLDALAPQCDGLLISANRHSERYAAFGHPVLADPADLEFAGPLAGVLAGLDWLAGMGLVDAWLLSAPCDCPHLPADLGPRLQAAAVQHGLAFARAGREHPTHALIHLRWRQPLAAYLRQGGRRVLGWLQEQPHGVAEFDDEACFANLNTPEALQQDKA